MRKILIIGGSGFLGTNVALDLARKKNDVLLGIRPGKSPREELLDKERISFFNFDVSDLRGTIDVMKNQGIDVVVHMASGLTPSNRHDDFEREHVEIINPAFRLFREIAAVGIKLVYFSSGGAIYGARNGLYHENDTCAPKTYYGQSKLLLESQIKFLALAEGLRYLIVRPSNPYGLFQPLRGKQGFISNVAGKVIDGTPVEIWGDGSVIRDYIYVDDLCWAIRSLIEHDVDGLTLNIGNGTGYSLLEVIHLIEEVLEREIPMTYKPAREVDVKAAVLDISEIRKRLPFQPMPLKDGIRQYLTKLKI